MCYLCRVVLCAVFFDRNLQNQTRVPCSNIYTMARLPHKETVSIHETRIFEVAANDDVFASIKHNLYVGRVGGAGAVMVDLPTRILVTCHKLSHKVIDAGVVTCLRALVVAKRWERCNWLRLDLLSK